MFAPVLLGIATTPIGTSGTPAAGVTALEDKDEGLLPLLFAAVTAKV